jgi:hypothetical protein
MLVMGLLFTAALAHRTVRFELSPEGLRLRGDFYGRFIPSADLLPQAAYRVDLGTTPGLTPRRRTMGTGLPGYQAGWFRLQNGDTALLYLTDRAKAVFVPTTQGYGLLLSPSDPERFLTELKATNSGG